ncbi:MAG: translation elongation factor Ts [Anaerolineae bacterium]
MKKTTELIKQLRAATGAGVLDCRKALEQAEGDLEKATAYLREKGLAAAAKKTSREASEGIIEAYAHHGNRVAVLVEVNCETDFVANTPEFRSFAHDIALHVAAMSPLYMTIEDIPAEELERKKDFYRQEALAQGKPEKIIERIIAGRLKKFYTDTCLMEQSFVKDDEVIIKDLVMEKIATLKENIVIRRFVRYELGEHASE